MPAGTVLVTQLARRVRDTTNFAHARTFLLETLNRCNRALNAAIQAEIDTTLIVSVPGRVLYRIPDDFSGATNILRVIGVRDLAGRDLQNIDFDQLVENDPEWLHRTGARPELFARVGRDLLVVYPAQTAPAELLVAVYVQLPDDLLDDSGETPSVPFERASILLDLAEVVVYLRGRIFLPESAIQAPLSRVAAALGIEMPYGSTKHSQVVP